MSDELRGLGAPAVSDRALACHGLLLRLAGQVGDDALAACRRALAAEDWPRLATALAEAVLVGAPSESTVSTVADGADGRRPQLTRDDLLLLDSLVEQIGLDPAARDAVLLADEPPLGYGFLPGRPNDADPAHGPEAIAVAAAGRLADVVGLWRTWRTSVEDARAPMQRVYLVECDRDPITVTAALMTSLADVDGPDPCVEAYLVGTALPPYHQLARLFGELLYARDPAPLLRMAKVFDEVDPREGPRFHPDHPRITDDEELAALLGYLRAAPVLISAGVKLDDVLDPTRKAVVPVDFRTDGTWTWSDMVTYYLQQHRLAPDAGLLTTIREAGYRPAVVDGVTIHRAMARLTTREHSEPPVWVYEWSDMSASPAAPQHDSVTP